MSFDCIRCGEHFKPGEGQWIFYKLCNRCFARFDAQKMRGRAEMPRLVAVDGHLTVTPRTEPHFEDAAAWAIWEKSQGLP